jgi:bifunctional non-homologous end joining protein LigD
VRGAPGPAAMPGGVKPKRRPRTPPARARAQRLPTAVGLQLARLVDSAPPGEGWLHEVKFDGYRILIWRDGKGVRITSRGDQDWTQKLPATAHAASQLRCRSCILDGELITQDEHGRSSFGLLQQRFGEAGGEKKMSVRVFDLLWRDGRDLRGLGQLDRKRELRALLERAHTPLELTEYVIGNGARAARDACAHGLEGIVSKAIDAPYTAGRGGAWIKVKCIDSDEYAIIGYTAGKGARERLGSLLLASPAADGSWRYRGRVGTGLNERLIDELLKHLSQLRAAEPPTLANPPDRAQLRGATPLWVRPQLVVEVEFRGYTEDQLLRQASLKGLRADRTVSSLRPARRDVARVRSPASAGREG